MGGWGEGGCRGIGGLMHENSIKIVVVILWTFFFTKIAA